MSNFNIKKFLTENKLTEASRRTNEEEHFSSDSKNLKEEPGELFLDAVFNFINDEFRSGNISETDFITIKNYIDDNDEDLLQLQDRSPVGLAKELIEKALQRKLYKGSTLEEEENSSIPLKDLSVGGKTYEVGSWDPDDDGVIRSIEQFPNGYWITAGTYDHIEDYYDGEEPKEGYGYALDLDGNEMDELELQGLYTENK